MKFNAFWEAVTVNERHVRKKIEVVGTLYLRNTVYLHWDCLETCLNHVNLSTRTKKLDGGWK